MSVKVVRGGIRLAELSTDFDNTLHAKRNNDNTFEVYVEQKEAPYDAETCREVAKFFAMLAQDLDDNQ